MSRVVKGNLLAITTKGSEKLFLIVDIDGANVRLEDTVSGVITTEDASVISKRLSCGEAEIISKNESARNVDRINTMDFAGYSEEDKFVAKYRLVFVLAVINAGVDDFAIATLTPIVDAAAEKEKLTPPSIRNLQRWLRAYIDTDYSIRGLLPQTKKQGNRQLKVDAAVEYFIKQGIEFYKKLEKPIVNSAYNEMVDLINEENELKLGEKLSIPSYNCFKKRLEKEAPFELAAARVGKKEARKEFKTKRQPPVVSTILERAEIDHTKLDLFVVDDESCLPLGRPWISSILDYYSRSVMGFYIGFEPPSYLSVNKVLKHALSSKYYVAELFPNVENEWPVYGIMNSLISDNGKEFESAALTDACLDLDIVLQLNPVKCPWYKGMVERHFGVINTELLDDKPGKAFSSILEKADYNPEKNAVISFSKLVEMMHIWVIDIYQRSPRSDNKLVPDAWWRKAAVDTPVFSVERGKLNIILGKLATPTLRKDGIVLDYLYYDSDKLRLYRQQMGYTKVKIKYDPDNLGEVHVFDENTKQYFTVSAVNQAYAQGLSTWQHQVIKRYCKYEIQASIDLEALSRAKRKIKELVALERLNVRSSAKTRARLARFLKIAQQTEIEADSAIADLPVVHFEDVATNIEEQEEPKPTECSGSDDYSKPTGEVADDWPDELDI